MCTCLHAQGKTAGTGEADLDEPPDVGLDSVSFETGLQTSSFSNTWEHAEETQCSTSTIKLDPYLETPVVTHPTLPEVLFVCVPALPRGALLEVAAQLLDLAGLEASRTGQTKGRSGYKGNVTVPCSHAAIFSTPASSVNLERFVQEPHGNAGCGSLVNANKLSDISECDL